jgi:nicotinate phosphoribosyltransferase
MITNFAKRADDHNFGFDPIVRSLLDTDFYKLLMLQFIWRYFRHVKVTFSILNRTSEVHLGEILNEGEIRRQLDHARKLRFGNSQLVWLAGNTFYGTRGMFEPAFIDWLKDFRLPPYELKRDGTQWSLSFHGTWPETTMWEIPALSILNELRTRATFQGMTESELDITFARAKVRLWDKIEKLRPLNDLTFTEFGTRRRHGFLWQDHVVQTLARELPGIFIGTSNVLLAMRHDLEAKGTNAHELPMVLGALARAGQLNGPKGPIDLKDSQYEVTRLWQEAYGGALLVMLPDTWGTTQFLLDAPDHLADWTGLRVDSKDPLTAGEEYIAWLQTRRRDPQQKMLLFSDGLDVDSIVQLHEHFKRRIRVTFGWGTLLTNDFRHCHPRDPDAFRPISLVCKVSDVEGHPAIKLSDNLNKAMGPAEDVAHYMKVFGDAGMSGSSILV